VHTSALLFTIISVVQKDEDFSGALSKKSLVWPMMEVGE